MFILIQKVKKGVSKYRLRLWFLSLLIAGVGFAEESAPPLSELVAIALEQNPRLQAAIKRYEAVEKRVTQAGALPDPEIRFGLMNLPVNSFALDQEPMTGKSITVMQMFPFPGKRSLASDIAELNAAAAKWQQEETLNQIASLVKKTYFDIYAIDRAIQVLDVNRTLMDQFVKVAEAKYATGSGLQQDVLRAQVELSKLEDDIIMWRQKRRATVAVLNALLNRPVDMDFAVIDRNPAENKIETEYDLQQVEKTRPLLNAWQEMLIKAETEIRLSRRDYWPNFSISASYTQRDDLKNGAVMHDFFSATVGLRIPLYFKSKQSAKVQEKNLNLAALKAEYESLRNQVFSEIESIKAEIFRQQKRIDLYKHGILIQARQSLESALTGYQVNKVDFLTLVNNWMMVQNYELQYYRALADLNIAIAGYELATGRVDFYKNDMR